VWEEGEDLRGTGEMREPLYKKHCGVIGGIVGVAREKGCGAGWVGVKERRSGAVGRRRVYRRWDSWG
jgi:hypothetical protein